MSRSICKPLFLLIAFVFAQLPRTLWAQSYGTISTFAGTGIGGFYGDGGQATAAQLNNPADVAIHPNGDIYIADQGNNRVRKIDSNGVITTVAGNRLAIDIDNVPATSAGLYTPSGIAFDRAGNLYIADTFHQRIRRVDGVTGIITTVAGTGDRGYNGDHRSATSAQLNYPDHVALDSLGNLFIADDGNNRIRRVDALTQIITTVAGNSGAGDNGDEQPATSASLLTPHGVMVDPAGNLFIADTGNHRVRFVDTSGVIHAYAGTGAIGDSGDGGDPKLARLRTPVGLGRDAQANIYIADYGSHRVRQVYTSSNQINTVAGTGAPGYTGDGGPADQARISTPESATIDARGRMYIVQPGFDVVRAVDHFGPPTSIVVYSGSPQTTAVNAGFSQPLVVLLRDATGTPVPGVSVSFTAPTSGASASFSPTTAITDANGQAHVNATANTVVGGPYTVLAEAPPLRNLAGFDLTNTAGLPTTIQFLQQPTNTIAGAPITPAVKISLKDAHNNPVAGVQVSVGATGLDSGGGFQNTDSSGVATYANLKFEEAGTYELSASSINGLATRSNSFQITPGSATKILASSGDGQTAIVGSAYAAPLQAFVYDAFGNGVAGVAVTFTAPSTGPSVTFSGPTTATTNAMGLATSPGMTANEQTGIFSVTAAAAGIQSTASFPLRNIAATASKLTFVQQPTDTAAGAPITPAVSVQLQDRLGNNVSTPGVSVTLQANPIASRASGFVANPTQSTDANGLATFTGIVFAQSSQFTLMAEASNVSSAISVPFTIHAGAPSAIQATGGTLQSALIQTPFAQQLKARVLDSLGNPLSGVTVTFTVPSSGASASLSASSAVTNTSGEAAVTATANSVAGSYSVTAGTAGVVSSASFSLTNLTGSVGHALFVQQPSDTPAGATISPAVAVHVTDAGSNPIGGASVTIQVQGGTPALGGTLSATTDATGVATFADLSITVAGSYRLEAVSSGVSALSDPFQISAATSAVVILAFEGDGQSAAVGTIYSGPLKARVEDPYHNPIANAPVTFAAPTSGASVTFSGPATISSGPDGVAIAPAMTANSQTGTFQVTATAPTASGPALFNLTNVPGAANKLLFVQQPVDTAAGATITPAVTVQLQDSAGNAVHTAGIAVTLQSNALVRRLKELSGSATQSTDLNGLATFANLSISQAGNYEFEATSSGLGSATSNPFRITAGTAAKIRATGGTPQSATVLTPFAQQLQVTVLDAFNNPVAGAIVTFATPGSGASATLSALSASTDANGRAAVTATANSIAGSYSVTASVTGVAASASFSLTNVTGAPGQISFVQQPSNTPAGAAISPAVTVRVVDSGGNPVSGAAVTASVQEATAPLGGTLNGTTDSSGLAIFADLNITTAGTYHLAVASGSISAPSNSFQILPAASAVVVIPFEGDGQSAAVGMAYSGPLKAIVEDLYHNPIANASVTFAAPTSGASVTFSGSATVATGADGIAVSPAMTANSQTGAFQVTATTAAASGPAFFNLTNVPGSANRLAFVQQPVGTVAGAAITPPLTVQIQDSAGNAVHTAGIAVTLQANATVRRLEELSGSATQSTDANGLATFANLSISQAGNYTLQANSTGLSSATSTSFTITAGTGTNIQPTGGTPQSTTVLTAFANQLQATVLDSLGNPTSGVMVTFAAPVSGASATLSAPSAMTDANGHAAVTATANGSAGCYTVSASAPGITQSASYSLCNVAAAISQIVFVVQPANTQAGVPITPPVVVRFTDASGNAVAGATVTMSLPSGETLNGTTTATTNPAGQASFDDLRVSTAGTYQLAAVNGSISAISNSFQVSGAIVSVTISVYDGDGQSALPGAPYGGPLRAQVLDLFGNPMPGIAVTFAAPGTGPSVTFAGSPTVATDANGIAMSPAMTANAVTGPFAVTATAPNAPAPATFPLANLPPAANKLTFVQHPTDTPAGETVTPPVIVQLLDSSGNPLHTANVPVTLQVNVPARRASTFSGLATAMTDANGVATFADLAGARAGTYQLQAETSSVASATSDIFQITTGTPATILATAGTPQGAVILTAFGIPLQVTVTDATGNHVANTPVTFVAPTSGPSGSFSGQSTFTANSDALGRVNVVITANNLAGTYGVTASSTTITGTALFTLTNLPPGAGSLAFVQQPGNTAAGQAIAPPVTVQVRDSTGHPVGVSGLPIIMSLATGTGTLSGSLVQLTEANGIATFGDLRISQTGGKQLRAATEQQLPADSNTFQIVAGPPANIALYGGSPQSTTIGQPFPEPLQALVTDDLGDPISGVSVIFSSPATGPSGTFNGSPVFTTGADGIATSPTLVANSESGNFMATAMATGAGGAVQYALANLSQQTATLVPVPTALSFSQEIGQPPPPGQNVQISTTGQIPVNWTASSSATWLAAVPASGHSRPGKWL